MFQPNSQSPIVILPPMDVFNAIQVIKDSGLYAACTILDPWYNKGVGGELPLPEYDAFVHRLLWEAAEVSGHIFLWGFPEVIGAYLRGIPEGFRLTAWLTWYYKNCPSVVRGWRSSQQSCIHFSREGEPLYPEHFLEGDALVRYKAGGMRFVPGPSSVIECPLNVGFVGKREQTGHPCQKPEAVFAQLIRMTTKEGDLVFDPMAGSGTTAACAKKLGRYAVVSDGSEVYTTLMENRLGQSRASREEENP